ncbi:TOPRIM nucleotidyl transferase/hydrolase domain-containing protein [Geodermatophilus amargosae]|uniref:TOPRIM nucleotidyl transferase/hydrolase domain-containing protein n=1 Tax=Geodermatophilus amargosae TaxID=1296565 RepID=UPI0034DE82F0
MAASAQLPTAVRAVLLVEGTSDREAVMAAARGQGRDLPAEGVRVVPMGGATALRRHLALVATGHPERLGPPAVPAPLRSVLACV